MTERPVEYEEVLTASAARRPDSMFSATPGITPSASPRASVRKRRSGLVSTRLRILGLPRKPPEASCNPHLRALAVRCCAST